MADLEIKDLVGLEKPLTKLIEVSQQGVGAVARPWLLKQQAKALVEASKILAEQGLAVTNAELGESFRAQIEARTDYREAVEQRNLLAIVEAAKGALPETVSDDPLDPDWIKRFFDYSRDVSSGQMQRLWGRLLAREVGTPKSVSIRTVELVRNLSARDAQLVSSVLSISLDGYLIDPGAHMSDVGNTFWLDARGANFWQLYLEHGLGHWELELMKEVGFVHGEAKSHGYVAPAEAPHVTVMRSPTRAFWITLPKPAKAPPPSEAPRFSFYGFDLTTAARELSRALEIPRSELFEKKLSQTLESKGFQIEIHEHPAGSNPLPPW